VARRGLPGRHRAAHLRGPADHHPGQQEDPRRRVRRPGRPDAAAAALDAAEQHPFVASTITWAAIVWYIVAKGDLVEAF
jgi:hypothetical protein